MSHIIGKGWGDSHEWRAGWTGPSKGTPYKCEACDARFTHFYDNVPNIFTAMKLAGVPNECPTKGGAS